MSEEQYKPLEDEIIISISDDVDNATPVIFKETDYPNMEVFIKDMIKNKLKYAPSLFSRGYRSQANFVAAQFVVLDVDEPTIEQSEIEDNIKSLGLNAVIVTSKSHNKLKSNVKCARYHIFIMLSESPLTHNSYKATCRELSDTICLGNDDKKCHDGARFFYPSPKDAEITYFHGDNLFDPIVIDAGNAHKHLPRMADQQFDSGYNVTKENVKLYQNYINRFAGLKHVIAKHNPTNNTFNLFRNEDDANAGCFMLANDNRIFDNNNNVKVATTNYSFSQIAEASDNSKIDTEVLRTETHKKIIDSIDVDEDFNVIITSEGCGKSALAPAYLKKFNVKRGVMVCKGYDQLYNKKKMFKLKYPDLKIEIMLGAERFLTKFKVHESEWLWATDEDTGDKYISLFKTIEASEIDSCQKSLAIRELTKYENIVKHEHDVDIILMVEDKLKAEALLKNNFLDDLIIYDEFNPSHFFQDRVATEHEKFCGKFDDRMYQQETWQGFFTTMIKEKHNYFEKLRGKKIVLSTENKAIDFFTKHYKSVNIINRKNTFSTPKAHIYSVAPKMLNRDNKNYLSSALRSNNYICFGNGINSKINHVSMLGQNFHGVFNSDDKFTVFVTQPSPEELAPIMKNLNISDKEATILLLSDVLNQYLGRFNGYREEITYAEFNMIIPNNLINDILPHLRYVCHIHRSLTDRYNKTKRNSVKNFTKILHTVAVDLNIIKFASVNMYMKSLFNKTVAFMKNIDESIGITSKLRSMGVSLYKYSKEQLKSCITFKDKYGEMIRYKSVYSKKSKLISILYSDSDAECYIYNKHTRSTFATNLT